MTERFAVYFAPAPDTPLWDFGTSWLGRDPERDIDLPRPDLPGLEDGDIARISASPRRYGFHGTLKPPFGLADGQDAEALYAAVAAFAASRVPFDIPALEMRSLDGFLALVPAGPGPALAALAGDCVATLDGFRAPPPANEMDRRRAHGLTARQEANLTRWGYPYVMEDFRFHLTLTDRLDPETLERALPILMDATVALTGTPVRVDSLALYHEPRPGADFRLVARFPFGGDALS